MVEKRANCHHNQNIVILHEGTELLYIVLKSIIVFLLFLIVINKTFHRKLHSKKTAHADEDVKKNDAVINSKYDLSLCFPNILGLFEIL